MEVEVKYYAMIRDITKKRSETIELPQGANVKELLQRLIKIYGDKLENYIYNKDGEPRNYLAYMLNGKNILSLNRFKTLLSEGDTLSILPPIGGG